MAKLIVHHGTPQAREFELKPGTNQLGRGEDNDCQIADGSVSTHHAQIIMEGGTVRIKDLGSTNGTFINQAPVTEAILQPGQSLRFGVVNLLLQMDGQVPAPVRAPINLAAQATVLNAPAPVSVAPAPVAGGGLRIPGLRHAEPEPAPATEAVVAAAAVAETELAEAPAGKTMCKFHPKIGGHWLCRKCNELFCDLCVTNKPSHEGTVHSCRKCGSACVPVKVKITKAKEKAVVVYSDQQLLLRSLGFGFGGALLGALIWTGLSWLFGFDVPFLFAPMVGALCGYMVKIGCQDTPSPVFSSIAVVCCIIGSVLGKLGMIWATHLTIMTNTVYLTAGLGLLIAMVAAWKIGGAE